MKKTCSAFRDDLPGYRLEKVRRLSVSDSKRTLKAAQIVALTSPLTNSLYKMREKNPQL